MIEWWKTDVLSRFPERPYMTRRLRWWLAGAKQLDVTRAHTQIVAPHLFYSKHTYLETSPTYLLVTASSISSNPHSFPGAHSSETWPQVAGTAAGATGGHVGYDLGDQRDVKARADTGRLLSIL